MNQKGSTSFFLIFVYLSVLTLVLFALVIPFMQQMNTELFEAGSRILDDANKTAAEITNPQLKAQLQESYDAQVQGMGTQIDILGTFYNYGWIIIILIVVLVLFMISRQTVELEIR
jgi:predicted PurR-regulated permease PerM